MNVTSNETLCNLFEALISRIDHMEDRFDELGEQLKQIILNKKHTDSIGHTFPSASFSGLAHCGRCVELHVMNIRFDVEGLFDSDYSSFMLFLTDPECPFSGDGLRSWEYCPETAYDEDLRLSWGMDKYNAIRSRIAEIHSSEPKRRVTCDDLGLESKHPDLASALYEIVLRHRVPAVAALGWGGIALYCGNSTDLRSVLKAMDCASALFGAVPSKYIQINQMDETLEPLALAYLRNTDWRKEFTDLEDDDESRNIALGMMGKNYSGSFFRENSFE